MGWYVIIKIKVLCPRSGAMMVVFMMVSFCVVLFPRDVLDETLDLTVRVNF